MASLLQLPVWVYISGALRNLCKGIDGKLLLISRLECIFFYQMAFCFSTQDHSIQMEQLTNSGFLWIDSLTQYDPTYILPGLFLLFSFTNLNVSPDSPKVCQLFRWIIRLLDYSSITCYSPKPK